MSRAAQMVLESDVTAGFVRACSSTFRNHNQMISMYFFSQYHAPTMHVHVPCDWRGQST